MLYDKIPVVADLPVGENLKDHLMVDAVVHTFEKPVSLVPERFGMLDQLKYKLFGTGIEINDFSKLHTNKVMHP